MSKRLIVLCDGTWNGADQPALTNVCKLRDAVEESDRQVVHYEAGVGTKRWERIRGGAFGIGLSRNVQHCYEFLVEEYAPGDELFFFGFSRGAFTARSLAGLVRNSGILAPSTAARSRTPTSCTGAASPATAERGRRRGLPRQVLAPRRADRLHRCLGHGGRPRHPYRRPPPAAADQALDVPRHDAQRVGPNAYHAISIDERRGPFAPTLWVKKVKDGVVEEPPEHQTVSQVWFAGVHSDVGGGYPASALSEVPLRWMADRARDCGLVLRPDRLVRGDEPIDAGKRRNGSEIGPDACGPKHDSMTLFYRLLGPRDRKLGTREGIPINPSLASSVKVRSAAGSLIHRARARRMAGLRRGQRGRGPPDQIGGRRGPGTGLGAGVGDRAARSALRRELLRLRTRGASAGAEQLGRR